MGPNFMDEIDCGSFFDHIDDLMEFPPDSECGNALVGSADCKNFPSLWDEDLPGTDSLFSSNTSNPASDLSAELSVPYEDIVQLEWLSTFVEDSFSGGGMTLSKDNSSANKENSCNQFQTCSPVSVLESSSSSSSCCSSYSGGKAIPLTPNHRGPQRARSKRSRPATFNARAAIQLISPVSSIETPQPFLASGVSSESENFAEQKKKKKIKLTVPLCPMEINQNPPSQAVRKCMHCEITKTPQWRAGPMGPKTLCNACGVRHKSGRLFPEYRPAASPTFMPSLHSNSHKKVLEMRGVVVQKNTTLGTAAKASTASRELVPESEPLLEYI